MRHDARTPIAVILGRCELLLADLQGPLTDAQRASLQTVVNQTHRLEALLDTISARLDG